MSQSVSGTHPYDLLPYTENDTEVCDVMYKTIHYCDISVKQTC